MRRVLLATLLAAAPAGSFAQPVRVSVETAAVASTDGVAVPLWLQAHRDGAVAARGTSAYAHAGLTLPARALGPFRVDAGARLTAQAAGKTGAYVTELYGRAVLGGVGLRVGRFAETRGLPGTDDDARLATGSFTLGRNAVPVTRVVLASDGFLAVPGTGRWVEVAGAFGHGWMEPDRYVRSPYLHEAAAYLRVGGPSAVRVHAGLHHSALWAGTHPVEGRLPQSFKDYLRVVAGRRGGDDAPMSERGGRLGAHLGFWDFGAGYGRGSVRARVYRHVTFDDPFGFTFGTLQDGVLGLALRRTDAGAPVAAFVYEHVYTKRQADRRTPETLGQVSNYYNNYLYASGYTHEGRTMGNPLLFLPDEDHDPPATLTANASNRIVAHHVGVEGALGAVRYRTLVTYSRNYGNYADEFTARRAGIGYRFDGGPRQVSGLVEADAAVPGGRGVRLRVGVGVERGRARGDALGFGAGLRWEGAARPAR